MDITPLFSLEEIREKYGNVKLKFQHYFKYSFSFYGKADTGEEVYVSVGGNADDIYRLDVSSDREETIISLDPDFISISKDGKKLVNWSTW